MVAGISKLTKPRMVRLVFRPMRISRLSLPPLLLERKPSRLAVEYWVRVVGVVVGVAASAVGFGELKGVAVTDRVGLIVIVG